MQDNQPGADPYKEECKDQKNRRWEAIEGDGTVEMVMVWWRVMNIGWARMEKEK